MTGLRFERPVQTLQRSQLEDLGLPAAGRRGSEPGRQAAADDPVA